MQLRWPHGTLTLVECEECLPSGLTCLTFAGANPLLLDHTGRSPRQCCSTAAAELVLYETPREEQQAALERCVALLEAAEAAAAPELQRTRKASAACGQCGGQVELRKCSG